MPAIPYHHGLKYRRDKLLADTENRHHVPVLVRDDYRGRFIYKKSYLLNKTRL